MANNLPHSHPPIERNEKGWIAARPQAELGKIPTVSKMETVAEPRCDCHNHEKQVCDICQASADPVTDSFSFDKDFKADPMTLLKRHHGWQLDNSAGYKDSQLCAKTERAIGVTDSLSQNSKSDEQARLPITGEQQVTDSLVDEKLQQIIREFPSGIDLKVVEDFFDEHGDMIRCLLYELQQARFIIRGAR